MEVVLVLLLLFVTFEFLLTTAALIVKVDGLIGEVSTPGELEETAGIIPFGG